MPTRCQYRPLCRPLLAAAVLAVMSTGVLAQTRVDRSGATDASNRVGSGGRNAISERQTPWEISNQVVYGNITGGKQFRGPTASTDPQAFRGRTAGDNFDRFVRSSSGVTTGGVATYNANQTRTYYGDSRAVAPPAGFVGVTTQGGYTPPVQTPWQNIDPRASAVSVGNTTTVNVPNSNTLVAGGEVNTQYAPNSTNGATDAGVNSITGLSEYTNLNSTNVANLTPSQIKQMQGDSPNSQLPGQTPSQQPGGNVPSPQQQQVQAAGTPANLPSTPGNTPANGNSPFSTPNNANGTPNGTPNAAGNTPPAGGFGATQIDNSVGSAVETGTVTRMVKKAGQVDTADATGTADAAAARNNGPDRPGQAAEEANRQFNAEVRKNQKAGDAKKDADQPQPKGDANAKPADAKPGDNGQVNTPANKGGTFAGQVTDRGVSELLTKAEGQMKDGKFASAIDTYGAAEAISPKSATVKLGRANAELGGSYYRRAEASLRQAYLTDANLLKTQYDLRSFLGDDRLVAVQKELSDQVQARQTDTGPAVLLAYVYYNTGNEGRATALLDLADKRAGGRDALVRAMKNAWGKSDTK